MHPTPSDSIEDIMAKVRNWPADQRRALLKEIARTFGGNQPAPRKAKKPWQDLLGIIPVQGTPPTDDECRNILEEELLKKYGEAS
jgi:hypothetical protein